MEVDAVVCTTNTRLKPIDKVSKAIYKKYFLSRNDVAKRNHRHEYGQAVCKEVVDSHIKNLICAVRPRSFANKRDYRRYYEHCITVALENNCETVAIPLVLNKNKKVSSIDTIIEIETIIINYLNNVENKKELIVYLVLYTIRHA